MTDHSHPLDDETIMVGAVIPVPYSAVVHNHGKTIPVKNEAGEVIGEGKIVADRVTSLNDAPGYVHVEITTNDPALRKLLSTSDTKYMHIEEDNCDANKDHRVQCCAVHQSHVIPHRGCIMR